jgi:apolipoprotein N-acyltransferase
MLQAYKQRKRVNPSAYGAPVLSGLVLILAFPPFEQGYLAWIALIPLLWFCLTAPPRQALLGGFLFSFPLHLYLNLYLSGVLLTHLPASLAIFAMALLILIICAFYSLLALIVACYARSKYISSFSLIFIIPALWVLMEYSRSIGFLGYTVGFLGYTQWNYPLVLNLTSTYGYWGLAYAMVAAQTLFVLCFMKTVKRKALGAGFVVTSVLILLGLTMPAVFPREGENEVIRSALIQGNSRPDEILSAPGREIIFNRYLEMTRQAAEKDPDLQLVVWPETVADLRLTEYSLHRPEMEALAEDLGLDILYGARVKDGENLYNAAVLLSPGKDDFQIYNKQLLVPFVEYFPMHELLNAFLDLELLLGRYSPGEKHNLIDVRGVPLAAVVCFESYFGSYTRHFSKLGGRHMFILTNDVWFDETIGKEQHAQVAAIRAAEMGIGVTQVANSGITASFDYRGRELFRSGKSEPDIFILPLQLTRRTTFYTLAGDFFPALCSAFVIALTLAAVAKKLRRRHQL